MFEREFEFTVHHPLEVCEERVLDMAKYGCFPQPIFRVSAQIISLKRDSFSQIYLRQPSRGRHRVVIIAAMEQVSDSMSKVSGVASVIGFPVIIWWSVSLTVIWIFLALYHQYWQLLCLAIGSGVLLVWSWIQAIYFRNRLIKRLENALTQQKKKKA